MKNILKTLGIFLVISLCSSKVFSYWLDFENKWFYSSISENIGKLGSDLYSIELQNNWWTKKKIAQKSGVNCLNRDLSEEEIKKVAIEKDISWLSSSISKECKTPSWEIDKNKFDKTVNWILEVYIDSQNIAQSKSEKTMWISNIWIYTDWIEKNWPFDIFKDFEEIDKIIFEQEEYHKYQAEEEIDLWEKIKEMLNKLAKNNSQILGEQQENNPSNTNSWNWTNSQNFKENIHTTLCDLSWNCDNYTEVQQLLCERNWNCDWEEKKGFFNLKNNFECKIDSSWLNEISWKIISSNLNNIWNTNKNSNWNSIWKSNNWWTKNWWGNSWWWVGWAGSSWAPDPKKDYKKLNDNKWFPCNTYFCIDIEFKTYDHNLLWWWKSEDPSIEFLVKRSNGHLKRFVNSPLSQSKMTINNFELWLKDLNLPEMFHIWFQISYEPVPLYYLNKDLSEWVDKETNQDNWELKLKSQLEKYYKANQMDYKLRNDLSAFNQIDRINEAWLNSSWSSVNAMSKKLEQLRITNNKKLEELDSLRNTIEEKVRYDINWDLEIQMKEVEVFNKAMNIYVINIDTILDEMIKIPVDWTMT